jgi:hypothetical protein
LWIVFSNKKIRLCPNVARIGPWFAVKFMAKCQLFGTLPLHAMSAKPSDIPPNDLHTAEEVAAFLKVDPKTVFNWAKSGIILEAFRVGKTARFSLEAVKASLEMKCPAMGKSKRSTEDIVRLALTTIDPVAFPAPAWMLRNEELDVRDAEHARLLADLHRESIIGMATIEEKIAYAGGVLDAQFMMDEERRSGIDNGGA